MLKTSLEIAFRLIFHDFLTHGRERVKVDFRMREVSMVLMIVTSIVLRRNGYKMDQAIRS